MPESVQSCFELSILGGRLSETENKRICQISGLKSGRGPLEI